MDFITIRLNIESRDNFDIATNYIQSEFLFDVIATLPTMFSNHSNKLIFLRFFHVIHLQKTSLMLDMVLEFLIHYSTIVRNKINVSIRVAYLILFGVHFCVVLWLFIGTRQTLSSQEKPWIKQDHRVELYNYYQLYVLSIYWIFTLVTTVGFGDLVGSTGAEYFITVFLEFGGFFVQSGFLWLILQLLERNYDFSMCLSEKQSEYEHWLSQLEKSNAHSNLNPALLMKMRKSLEDAFLYDFNMIIEEFEMYKNLNT